MLRWGSVRYSIGNDLDFIYSEIWMRFPLTFSPLSYVILSCNASRIFILVTPLSPLCSCLLWILFVSCVAEIKLSLWFLLDSYVQVCSLFILALPFAQTDDVLPNLEEQGVRQLYPKGPNVGNVCSYSQKAVFVPTVICNMHIFFKHLWLKEFKYVDTHICTLYIILHFRYESAWNMTLVFVSLS